MTINRYALAVLTLAGAILGGLALSLAVHVIATSLQPPSPGRAVAGQDEQDFRNSKSAYADSGDTKTNPRPAALAQADSQESNRPHKYKGSDRQTEPSLEFGTIADWVMVGVTSALAAIAIINAWSLCRQISDARLRQRAWVVTKAMDGDLRTNQPLPSTMTVFNSGETPAFIYRRIIEAFVLPREKLDLSAELLAVSEKLEASDEISVALAPGQQEHTFNETHNELVLNDELQATIAHEGGTDTIFLIGMIRYRDTYETDHTSICCYRWNAAPNKKKFTGHIRHNKMT